MRVHPIHMMLVHFPSALLPVDMLLNVISEFGSVGSLNEAAYYCLMAGVFGGWLAAAAGFFDFIRFIKPGSAAVKKVTLHLIIQVTVIVLFSIILGLEYKNINWRESPTILMLTSKGLLLLAMFGGNFLGSEIVFQFISKEFQA